MSDKIYLNYDAVERHCLSIGREIVLNTWHPDYIVGLTRGGLLPATLLSQYLEVQMYSLDVSLRDSDMGPTSNAWMSEDALNGKNILVVDDINDSGATLDWIVNDWMTSNRPASAEWKTVFGGTTRFATVVNNVASDFKNISYSGMNINKDEDDAWIVFPWEEWWTAKLNERE